MNPARSLAPAVVSGTVQSLWVYLLAPVMGSALAVICFRAIKPPVENSGTVDQSATAERS
jgi:glycerol uptake facilitator-like aquaporin